MWKPVDGFADVGMRLALSDMDDTAIEDVTIDKPKSGIRYNLMDSPWARTTMAWSSRMA